MNQKIEELIKLSTVDNVEQCSFNKEKFAELIVRECIKIADNHSAYEVMDDIFDHFGIKDG